MAERCGSQVGGGGIEQKGKGFMDMDGQQCGDGGVKGNKGAK